MVGLLCAPLTFVGPVSKSTSALLRYVVAGLGLIAFNLLSPPVVLLVACNFWGVSVEAVLTQAAFGWDIWGMWSQVVVWCVWWPAWLVGGVILSTSVL